MITAGHAAVGERRTALKRSFASAPLDDLLATARGDWSPSENDQLMFRYSIERADDTAASTLIRAIGSASHLRVFQQGRIELVQDFPDFDHNGDGRVDDNDLLFAVTLRSATPDRPLIIPDADNTHIALFIQDNWRAHPQLTLNLGLRYELDTDVKNVSRTDELTPIIRPFLGGTRHRDKNNFGPRVGFNWAARISARNEIQLLESIS
jgi:outer membrane receptor protein involved in Fe transport